MKVFARLDPYRVQPGRDLEGQNIFRVTLGRLEEEIDPALGSQFDDILAFARGECLERLGRWEEAAEAFELAASGGTAILTEEAEARRQWDRRIALATRLPDGPVGLDAFLIHLDARRAELGALISGNPAPPYSSYLLLEREKALAQKTNYLFANRFVIRGGADGAVEAAELLIEENEASHRFGEHLLLLGYIHENRARDYAQLNDPTSPRFDLDLWRGLVARARAAYTRLSRADGDPAKPEGQARLRALEAFAERTLARAR